eukprot:6488808-Amphidinium_carterae.4
MPILAQAEPSTAWLIWRAPATGLNFCIAPLTLPCTGEPIEQLSCLCGESADAKLCRLGKDGV